MYVKVILKKHIAKRLSSCFSTDHLYICTILMESQLIFSKFVTFAVLLTSDINNIVCCVLSKLYYNIHRTIQK